MTKIFPLVLFFLVLQLSCKNGSSENKKVIAKISGNEIYLNEADKYVQYELYEALQRIYVLRKAAAEELIDKKVIELEAKSLNLSYDQFLDKEINNKINDSAVNIFIKSHHLDSIGMPDITKGYRIVFPNTTEGKLMARDEYKKNLKNELVQSIKSKYKIDFFLTPPTAPKIDINDLSVIHYRGNLQSNKVVVFISDFTCENCRAAYPVLEKIFEKYKDKIKFGFTHFSPSVTLASICAEAANVQGKFWKYESSVFSTRDAKNDTSSFIAIANRIGLNIDKFRQDISGDSIRKSISMNIDMLKAKKIYSTPTILLNGTVILDSTI